MKAVVCLENSDSIESCRAGFNVLAKVLGYESCIMLADRPKNRLQELPLLFQGSSSVDVKEKRQAIIPFANIEIVPGIRGSCIRYLGVVPPDGQLERYYLDELSYLLIQEVVEVQKLLKLRLPSETPVEALIGNFCCGHLHVPKSIDLRKHLSTEFKSSNLQVFTMALGDYSGVNGIPDVYHRFLEVGRIWRSCSKKMPSCVESIEDAAEISGVKPMIEALFSGVPLEDVLC